MEDMTPEERKAKAIAAAQTRNAKRKAEEAKRKPRYALERGRESDPAYAHSLTMAAREALVDTAPTASDSREYIIAWAAAVRAGS